MRDNIVVREWGNNGESFTEEAGGIYSDGHGEDPVGRTPDVKYNAQKKKTCSAFGAVAWPEYLTSRFLTWMTPSTAGTWKWCCCKIRSSRIKLGISSAVLRCGGILLTLSTWWMGGQGRTQRPQRSG